MKAKAHGKKVRKEQAGREIRETGRLREHIRELEKKLFCLWGFICTEGLIEEAREYLEENADSDIPFDFE